MSVTLIVAWIISLCLWFVDCLLFDVTLIGVLIVFIFLFATLDINAIRVTVEGDFFQKDRSLLYWSMRRSPRTDC